MKRHRIVRRPLIYGILMIAAMFYLPTTTNAQVNGTLRMKASHDMSVFYWLIVIIGGIIAITLTYVGYRKYKGEKKKHKSERSNN